MFMIVGIIFAIAGMILYKAPAAEINGIYGYRTVRSAMDRESWDFAQKHAAKCLAYAGVLAAAAGLAAWYVHPDILFGGIVMMLQMLIIIPVFLDTESKLKRMQRR